MRGKMLTWMGAGVAGAFASPCAAPAPSAAEVAAAVAADVNAGAPATRAAALATVDITRRTFSVAAERADWPLVIAVARAVEHRFDLLALAPSTRVTVWRSGTTLLALLVDRSPDEGGPFFAQRATLLADVARDRASDRGGARTAAPNNGRADDGYAGDGRNDDAGGFVDAAGRSLDGPMLARPVRYLSISSRVGMREHPLRHRQKFHAGTDYAAAVGTPVVALGDGVVTKVKRSWTAGKFAVVRFSDGAHTYEAKYLHLSAFAPGLAEGTRVEQGQLIGRAGATGRVTGPHLHFELRTAHGLPLDLAAQQWPGEDAQLDERVRETLALRQALLLDVGGRAQASAWSPLCIPHKGVWPQPSPTAPVPARQPMAPVRPSRTGMSISTHAPRRRRRHRVTGPPPLFDLDAKSLLDPLILRTLELAATFA